jgi:metal-responsive CopG/Arc/MetJ family transcriptional regulator
MVGISMSSKTISVNIPEEMLPEIDEAARHEKRSRSEVVREALWRYLSHRRGRMIPLDEAQPDEIEAIGRGREEIARGDFVRLEDLQRELGLPIK